VSFFGAQNNILMKTHESLDFKPKAKSMNNTLLYTSKAVVLQERLPLRVRSSWSKERIAQMPVKLKGSNTTSNINNKKPVSIIMPQKPDIDSFFGSSCGSGSCVSPRNTNTISHLEEIEKRGRKAILENIVAEDLEMEYDNSKSKFQTIEVLSSTPSPNKRKAIKLSHTRNTSNIISNNSTDRAVSFSTIESRNDNPANEKGIRPHQAKHEEATHSHHREGQLIKYSVVDINSATNISANRLKFLLLFDRFEKRSSNELQVELENEHSPSIAHHRIKNLSMSAIKRDTQTPQMQPTHFRKLSASKKNIQSPQERVVKYQFLKGKTVKNYKVKTSSLQNELYII